MQNNFSFFFLVFLPLHHFLSPDRRHELCLSLVLTFFLCVLSSHSSFSTFFLSLSFSTNCLKVCDVGSSLSIIVQIWYSLRNGLKLHSDDQLQPLREPGPRRIRFNPIKSGKIWICHEPSSKSSTRVCSISTLKRRVGRMQVLKTWFLSLRGSQGSQAIFQAIKSQAERVWR